MSVRSATLRVGCHNVNGLAAKLQSLTAHWQRLRLDVVVAVDTHVDFFARPAVQRSLSAAGWASYWCMGLPSAAGGRTKAGVAVLLRSSLVLSGALGVAGDVCAVSNAPAQGRLLSVPLTWAGQRFDVIGVYLHAQDAAANAAIISGPLAAMQRSAHPNLLILGDFNFVPDSSVDRRSALALPLHQTQHDSVPAAAWNRHIINMHDAWRALHPHRRAFTYVRSDAASRLDRAYVASSVLRQVVACSIADHLPAVSDHSAVVVQLLPAHVGAVGPGLPRLRLTLQSDPVCRQTLHAWLALQQPPDSPEMVLDAWWPAFKQQLQQQVCNLNYVARQRRAGRSQPATQAAVTAQLAAARARLETCPDADLSDTLQHVVASASQLATLQQEAEALQRGRRRQDWVHSGERPSPIMSKLLQPPKGGTYIHALRAPGSGHLLFDGVHMSQVIGHGYASVTAAPHIDQQARTAVLQAVAQHSARLASDDAQTLGAPVVTRDEVLAAIARTAPGRAPGLDGIPGELFRAYRDQLSPLLAALYSAIGALHRVPAGFLDGVILPILKHGGQAADPHSYRPIQLLNYDYRILAKLLSLRLLPVIGCVIDQTQCAFLHGRQIKDSIRLLQLLPALLCTLGESAVAVFTDFRKAYDTTDRGFLIDVAGLLGVGDGFLSWMQVLLTHTYTCALVNGFKSAGYRCEAGVRQGCPLSPLLYLFVGQALLCWLKQNGLGLTVADCLVTAAQYADDAEPILTSLAELPAFLECMSVFAAATGQHLNPTKTKLLMLGQQQSHPEPATGLAVSSSAKALGVVFDGGGGVEVDFEARMTLVKHRLAKIASIPHLSSFGRAFATNAYALGTLLYGAQFACGIPDQHAAVLQKWCAGVIDASLSPEGSLQRPPGIPMSCMAAHPTQGGFGLLPLQHHMLSRWACEARDMLVGPPTAAPWIRLAWALWREWSRRQLNTALQISGNSMWGLAVCPKALLFKDPAQPHLLLPQPLRVFARGIRALPPLSYVSEQDISGMSWTAPLWSNPLFVAVDTWDWQGTPRQVGTGLEHVAPPGLLNLPSLQCLGQLVALRHELLRVCASNSLAAHAAYNITIHPVFLQHQPQYANKHQALTDVEGLLSLLPSAWVAAAEARFAAARASGASIATLMTVSALDHASARDALTACLGWRSDNNTIIPLQQLTVAAATRLQRSAAVEAIQPRHAAFLAAATSLAGRSHLQLPTVPSVLTRWWQLRIANTYKESAWRLALDAFPTARRMHSNSACPACGEASPDFKHLFWSCPVADAVRHEVESQLLVAGCLQSASRLACPDIWLAVRPHQRLHRMVWDLICLAAIHAMEVGRRTAWAVSQRLTSTHLVEHIASRAARGAFWDAMADFAATIKVPREARTQLLTDQPCISWCVVLLTGNGMRVVRR